MFLCRLRCGVLKHPLTFAAFIFLLRSLESNACMYVWLDNSVGNTSDFGVLDLGLFLVRAWHISSWARRKGP